VKLIRKITTHAIQLAAAENKKLGLPSISISNNQVIQTDVNQKQTIIACIERPSKHYKRGTVLISHRADSFFS
jgi:hypothetical protein